MTVAKVSHEPCTLFNCKHECMCLDYMSINNGVLGHRYNIMLCDRYFFKSHLEVTLKYCALIMFASQKVKVQMQAHQL